MKALAKGFVKAMVLVLILLSIATTASAMSAQIRGGTDGGDTGKGSDYGLDVFFYEGKSFDFFVGYNRIDLSDTKTISLGTGFVQADTDAEINAYLLGLRWKMQTESSWKPFLSLGVSYLKTKFTPQAGLESYYEQPFEDSSTSVFLGLGVDVGITDNWSVGLEGRLFTNVPYYEEYLFGGGLSRDTYGVVTQLDLALRYHFF